MQNQDDFRSDNWLCPKCGESQKGSLIYCENCGSKRLENEQKPVVNTEQITEYANELLFKMKWYKFVIYVQLIINAFIGVWSGMLHLLNYKNLLWGILSLCLAAFSIFVRSRLAKYKRYAPSLYIVYIILYLVITIISFNISGISLGNQQIFPIIVFIILNIIYFHKRKILFTN